MLALTNSAVEVVREIVAASPEIDDESGGLRVTTEGDGFALGIVALPSEDDQVVEAEGARVFLEPEAAELLDDKVLDVSVVGERAHFTVGRQQEG